MDMGLSTFSQWDTVLGCFRWCWVRVDPPWTSCVHRMCTFCSFRLPSCSRHSWVLTSHRSPQMWRSQYRSRDPCRTSLARCQLEHEQKWLRSRRGDQSLAIVRVCLPGPSWCQICSRTTLILPILAFVLDEWWHVSCQLTVRCHQTPVVRPLQWCRWTRRQHCWHQRLRFYHRCWQFRKLESYKCCHSSPQELCCGDRCIVLWQCHLRSWVHRISEHPSSCVVGRSSWKLATEYYRYRRRSRCRYQIWCEYVGWEVARWCCDETH